VALADLDAKLDQLITAQANTALVLSTVIAKVEPVTDLARRITARLDRRPGRRRK
jgi:hypothetical protein